ncbi:two-component system response regulator AlgR [Litorivivens lipolytica]|uniref:Two-component system response regulator AlgR n=1 Tax=Litorivivens lipolytica TaxID=1524264 RepID=A0A7W4W4Y0_9GAMM|nr:LytTR family DNA-binding domain-containing protein [Litorivivens lipolytica]MBB3047512.1 two-component system response regulator AlgR [Litorivivens lipolytica]
MKVLIVDDEKPARQRLRRLLQDLTDVSIVAEAENGEQAIAQAELQKPDLVLMDIQMPGMDGLTAARKLAEWKAPPAVVFCTAYDEYALAAFEAAAVDYLLKPVEKAKLHKALERAQRFSSTLLDDIAAASSPGLLLTTAQGSEKLSLTEVLCLRAEQKYVVAVHAGGEGLLRESLSQLEQDWPDYFIRIHRNTLVARSRLRGIVRVGTAQCALIEGLAEKPKISRRHLPDVKNALQGEGSAR